EKISKCFRIYRRPSDHLKELLSFGKRTYHEPFWAVKDVDVSVERGCCLGIIGENGSGKSTLLRMIAGVIRPTSGAIEIGGRVSALLELGAGFNPLFTGRENIYLYASILGFTDAQTRERIPSIEKFAEIGEFVDRPVKTYSSGMFVRLAFAVAIHMDPDILIVDEALSVGDIFFQQRCIRRIQELKRQGVTILFVSHDLSAVRSLADRTIWMVHGRMHLEGKTDEVAAKYLAAMITRGRKEMRAEEPLGQPLLTGSPLDLPEEALERIPKFIEHIPNVDHRYGNGKARIVGIGVYSKEGEPAPSVPQGDRICVRISVEFQDDVEQPNLGFMMRNRLGEDVSGTNVLFEGEQLPAAQAGDRISVDFVMDLPFLQAGFYYFSPAAADGGLDQYDMCDWIENACAVEVLHRTTTHGHLRIPVRVRTAFVSRDAAATLSSKAGKEHSV
ncbi:MAG TPA: Wzt carbohydrate-binding domain-containing protein, partial [Terriglobia bacterium]|nr:Wzt carbohydrate-binding domain-containing protein [Terriglobia bacterium]